MSNEVTEAAPALCRWLFQHTPPIQCITLGGSRARGIARPGSDFDIFVFTQDEVFHDFVRLFPKALAEGLAPVFALRPPTLTRGFGFQYSAFSEALGPVDYFLVAPFVIQPFDHFGHHTVVFNHDGFFERQVLKEEHSKSDFSTAELLSCFEFRLSSLFTETKRNVLKGEIFQAQQALLELRSYAYGVIKTILYGELFDYTTKARRGDPRASDYYERLNQCVRRSGMTLPGDCADDVISVLMEAMEVSTIGSATAVQAFTGRFKTMIRSETP